MASEFCMPESPAPSRDSIPRSPRPGRDSILRLVEQFLPDLDAAVESCLQLSMEGAGGLGLEHWVGDGDRERPFRSDQEVSYRTLLEFVARNRERISGDSQDFLHYVGPWYDWALATAESKVLVMMAARSEGCAFTDAAKGEIVGRIREAVLGGGDGKP